MRKYLLSAIWCISILACKNDKSSSAGKGDSAKTETRTQAEGFLGAYNPLKLPYSIADTDLASLATTDTISYSVFSQHVPDTILIEPFGKSRKVSISPIGKIEQKGKESYLVTFVKDKNHSVVYLLVFDKKGFKAGMPLVTDGEDKIVKTAAIDKKLAIVINDAWVVKNEAFYKRTIYAYNTAGAFTTVLTETNEDRTIEGGVLNPLDTFPKKLKYSGDYSKGKKNVLFIRDSKTLGEYLFFIHFENEKENGCGGELKGSLKMASEKAGTFSADGDPCILNFTFKGNNVEVKEAGGCGNYRGIRCFFNDTYTKKKEPKTTAKKK